jgi:uncharacterized protein YrrD
MNAPYAPGMQASDREGRRVGIVEDVLYDQDGVARYLVIRDRGVFADDAVVPVTQASSDGASIRLAMTRAEVHAAPRYDPAQHGEGAGYTSAAAQQYNRRDGD